MPVEKRVSASARWLATIALGCMLVFASAGMPGGTTAALAQSGELAGIIFVDDVPGFVGADDADTVIACLPNGDCVTGEDNVLTGFRPAIWPTLRLVDDDLVIESDVDVQATAFGRILARDGFVAETFVSRSGLTIDDGTGSAAGFAGSTVAITPHPVWAPNNVENSDAVWISYANTVQGTAATLGTTFTVSESFSVPLGSTGTLDGFVFADDTAEVVIFFREDDTELATPVFSFNLSQNVCADGPVGCQLGDRGDLNLSALPPGDYRLEFTALQNFNTPSAADNPFGLMYAFDVILDPETVADVCWTFDGGMPGEKVCVSIADCPDCAPLPDQCPSPDGAAITLTSGAAGDAICDDLATQFFEDGVTDVVEEFQFVVGLDVPETSEPGSVRVATCTTDETAYVPICRNPASRVVDATVNNDIPLNAVETPRCVKIGGKTIC
jgi:hypothetical protein